MSRFVYALLFFFFCISFSTRATHLRAGYIHVSGEYPTVTINIIIYLDSESTVPFGGGVLSFGDGSEPVTLPDMKSTPRPDLGQNISMASYSLEHTYSDYGSYKINYSEPNRNSGILNIPNSVNVRFSIETRIILRPNLSSIVTPEPLTPLFFNMMYKKRNALALTCTSDDENDLILYDFTVPRQVPGGIINGYVFPKYLKINNTSGLLEWDLTEEDDQFDFERPQPSPDGKEFTFAAMIRQYAYLNGSYFLISSTIIDFQINVLPNEEDDEGIIIGGDSPMALVEEQQTKELQRTFTSSQEPTVNIFSNLKDEDLIASISYEDSDNLYTTSVNLEITNNSDNFTFPKFIILRSKTSKNYYKDDVVTVYFNEISEPANYITAITPDQTKFVKVHPNPSTGKFIFKGIDGNPMEAIIYDSKGEMLIKREFVMETEIELMRSGIYHYIVFSNERKISSGKLIVVK